MNLHPSSGIIYCGSVNIKAKTKSGDIVYLYNGHNEGLQGLGQFIGKALAGVLDTNLKPTYVDLIYVKDGNEISALQSTIPITVTNYNYSIDSEQGELGNAIFTATIDPENVKTIDATGGGFKLKMYSANSTGLATISDSANALQNLYENASTTKLVGIIDWKLSVVNATTQNNNSNS